MLEIMIYNADSKLYSEVYDTKKKCMIKGKPFSNEYFSLNSNLNLVFPLNKASFWMCF